MPKNCYNYVDWNNFKVGYTYKGNLEFKHVKGGVKLVETEYTIKDRKIKKEIEDFEKEKFSFKRRIYLY